MKTLLLALAGGVVSFLAFPPFGPGWLIVAGLALFLWSLRTATTRRQGFWVGFAYGLVFFSGFMWWLSQLELIALILIPVQALFLAVFGWWLAGHGDKPSPTWLLLAVGGWALMDIGTHTLDAALWLTGFPETRLLGSRGSRRGGGARRDARLRGRACASPRQTRGKERR